MHPENSPEAIEEQRLDDEAALVIATQKKHERLLACGTTIEELGTHGVDITELQRRTFELLSHFKPDNALGLGELNEEIERLEDDLVT